MATFTFSFTEEQFVALNNAACQALSNAAEARRYADSAMRAAAQAEAYAETLRTLLAARTQTYVAPEVK